MEYRTVLMLTCAALKIRLLETEDVLSANTAWSTDVFWPSSKRYSEVQLKALFLERGQYVIK